MRSEPTPTAIGYFGKIPSRGDFIKASDNPALVATLDDWLAQTMELLSADPRWKITYDALLPLHFAFVGTRRHRAIAGQITASSDQSKRRFPFLMMSMMEVDDPAGFVRNTPLALSHLWRAFETLSLDAIQAGDARAPLLAASHHVIDVDLGPAAHDAALAHFLDQQTVGTLDTLLAQNGFAGSVRQVLLALGLLLQPVLASGASRLEKSLVLPLPADPAQRDLVAAFWLHIITPFLARGDFELALFVTGVAEQRELVIGFSGASAQTLHAIMDPQVGLEHQIGFEQLAWVDEQIDAYYPLKKVSAYLEQDNLPLNLAQASLHAAFIGA